jgi:hypothetical protein
MVAVILFLAVFESYVYREQLKEKRKEEKTDGKNKG